MRLFKTFLPGLGLAVALFLFAYALGLIGPGASEEAQDEVSPVLLSAEVRLQFEAQLDGAHQEIKRLTRELEVARSQVDPKRVAVQESLETGATTPEDLEIPERLQGIADELGVSASALAAAYRLEMSVRHKQSAPGALDAVVASGADGFRAIVALMRFGMRATWQKDWLRKTYQPGLEQVLIDYAESAEQEGESGLALSCLSIADTQRVRDYLVRKVQQDPTPYTVYSAAEALGELKEPRGAAAIGLVFAQPNWGGVRGNILYHLGQMGGADARRILIEYLRMEKADQLGPAIGALNKIDQDVAKREATRILNREGAEFLDFMDRNALKKVADQE